jgi:hypothetical protein
VTQEALGVGAEIIRTRDDRVFIPRRRRAPDQILMPVSHGCAESATAAADMAALSP